MNSIQKYFDNFHEAIKLDTENEDLRKSRDAIKNRLNLSFEEFFQNTSIPKPDFFDQGSYAMNTGLKPHDNETYYDIDEGIKFSIFSANFPDPVDLKKLVRDALASHTDLGVKILGPCVRVIYSEQGEEKYHVDLAIYATNGQTQKGSILQLARGKEYSEKEKRYWEDSQPEALIDLVNNRFTDKNQNTQFRRIIKYLKRWKDIHFLSTGNSAPRGIAITVAVYHLFAPSSYFDGNPNDLGALINFVESLLSNVHYVHYQGEYVERIICQLPVKPHNDLFGKMTNQQMERFIKKLNELLQSLKEAQTEADETKAALVLAEVFGDDFPSTEVVKAFEVIKKPSLGYFPSPEAISGYETAPFKIEIKGSVLIKGKKVPLSSNKKILRNGRFLEFIAKTEMDDPDIYWRVVNTGKHVFKQANDVNNIMETFRGKKEKAGVLIIDQGKIMRVLSKNQMINQEMTAYTGKHWIECIAMENERCIARSKKFYVNIYNSEFDDYD